jgi:trigger factor
MMSQSFQDAVIQENLKPAGQPQVEPKQADEGKDFSFTATFEIFPEIKVVDLSGVDVKTPVTEINDSDVDQMIETLRQQASSYAESDKAAAGNDQVNIDFEGFKDGEAFEGGQAEGTDLVLGSKSMIPGFEDGLVGAKAGDEKELNLTFPEDYHSDDLKGAAVVFKVKVNSVSEQKLPELNEEFFERFGVKEGGVDELKVEVRKNMDRELKQALKGRVKQQVMDAVLAKNEFDIPRSLISQEINAQRGQMLQQFGGANLENFDVNSLLPDEMFEEQAKKRVSLGLVLSQLVDEQSIKAEADKVKEMVEEIASSYEASEEVINYYYNNKEQLAQVEAVVMEEAVVEYLLSSANVSDEQLSYDELMKLVANQQS